MKWVAIAVQVLAAIAKVVGRKKPCVSKEKPEKEQTRE